MNTNHDLMSPEEIKALKTTLWYNSELVLNPVTRKAEWIPPLPPYEEERRNELALRNRAALSSVRFYAARAEEAKQLGDDMLYWLGLTMSGANSVGYPAPDSRSMRSRMEARGLPYSPPHSSSQ